VDRSVNRGQADLIFDPQTSGGLLIALPEKESNRLVESLRASGVTQARVIARTTASDGPHISLSSVK
jgi:selenide,water dikinase